MSRVSLAVRLFTVLLAITFSAQADSFSVNTPLSSQGVFSCTDLTMSNGVVDSRGVVNATPANQAALRSNGNVRISGGTVNGDATAGPGKAVQLSGSGTVTGTASSAAIAANCTPIDLAPLASALQSANDNATIPLTAQNKNPRTGPAHTDFTLSGGDSATLHAGTYYFTKISLSGGSTIRLDGIVRILCAGRVDITGGSFFNADGSAYGLRLWVSGSPFNLSSSTLAGFVYAPAAAATVSAGTLKGALFANDVTISGSAHLTRILDDVAPRVIITAPADGSMATAASVAVTGTVTDGESAVSLTVNGQSVPVADDGSFQTTVSIAGLSPATITAVATDAAGNPANASVTLTVPRPTISSIAPVKGPTAGGTLVTINGTNFTNNADTTLKIGGVLATQMVVTSSTTLTARTPAAATAGAADVVVTTFAGNATLSAGFTYFVPPVISGFSPSQGGSGTAVIISGQNFDPDSSGDQVFFGALPATITSASATQLAVVVPAGAQTGKITVTTAGGSVTSTSDFVVATFSGLSVTSPTFTLDVGERLQFNAIGLLITGGGSDVTSRSSWVSSNGAISVTTTGLVIANAPGSADITASFSGFAATVRVTATAMVIPPDPRAVAPALDPTRIAPFTESTAFLYSGANAIQTGVAPNAIASRRAAVVRGRVLDRTLQPLAGARVVIAGHPELGQTLSRADGYFDLAVNGGGQITVRASRPGYLPADRAVNVPWHDFAVAADVALTPVDNAVTSIVSASATTQIARSTTSTDGDGQRTATLIFPPGTSASMTLPNGTTQSLPALTVRATEYTVGASGPAAMPAPLPRTTAYTYCVELSADEALLAGATNVTLSKPIAFYSENFLNFPVGMWLPVGYYDRSASVWMASDNGRVIKILSIANGTATIDGDGDGVADDAAKLTALGVTADELQQVARLYTAGQTLWRTPITHFTPYDANPMGGVLGISPNAQGPKRIGRARRRVGDSTRCGGSIIDCQNQSLGERIGLAGTGLTLSYNSGEQRGRLDAFKFDIPVTDAVLPPGILRAEVHVTTAGQRVDLNLPASANQTFTYSWDGRDTYGRPLQGQQYAHVEVGYVYPTQYLLPDQAPKIFAQWAKNKVSIGLGRSTATIATTYDVPIGAVDPRLNSGLGGWTFSSHHSYDPERRVLHLGTGETRSADQIGRVGIRVAGAGPYSCCIPTDGDARNTALDYPTSVSPAPDGSFYIANNSSIIHVSADGIAQKIAGTPNDSFGPSSPDGTPANQARIHAYYGAVGPDGFYFIDNSTRVRKIAADGTIVTVAGNGQIFQNMVEGPALQTKIDCEGLAVAPDGTIYIASSNTIEKVTTDGNLTVIAGMNDFTTNPGLPVADGVLAKAIRLQEVLSVAVGPNGDVYFADNARKAYMARITPEGTLNILAGLGTNPDTNGVPATSIKLNDFMWGFDVARDGTIYFATIGGQSVRAIRPDGIIVMVAGGVSEDWNNIPYPDNSPAIGSPVYFPWDAKVAADGSVLIVCYDENTIRKVTPAFPGASPTETVVGSAGGSAAYIFDSSGRHLRTVDAKTGAVLTSFNYDANGFVVSATDLDGNTTSVDRALDGTPSAIVAPGGQRTALTLDTNGYLSTVTDPGGEITRFTHDAKGLLTSLLTPRSNEHSFTYDADGLLLTDSDPAGGRTTLSRSGTEDKFTVTRTTAEGRVTTFDYDNSSAQAEQRKTTSSSGLTLGATIGNNESINASLPGGITVTGAKLPHPQFGMASPLGGKFSVKTGGGLTLQIGHSESVTLADQKNPLSVQSWTHTMTLNSKSYRQTFNVGTRTGTTQSPLGRSISRALDGHGHVTSVSVPGIATVSVGYDGQGRPTSVTHGNRSRTYSYNALNQLTSVQDALGQTMSFDYDANGRPSRKTLIDGRQVAFTYDADGNVTSITPPGRPAHTFTYNAVDVGETYTPPSVANGGGATRLQFNHDHQITTATRPDGTQITYGYDAAGRLNSLATAQGGFSYSYDSGGLIQSATAPSGVSVRYARDGLFPTTVTWSGTVNATIATTYDNNLRPTSTTLGGGTKINYAYDDDGLLTAVGPESMTREAANGRISGITTGVLTESITHGPTGEVSDRAILASGTPLLAFHYTRDAAGRITAITETAGAGASNTRTFTYDTAGRLASVTADSTAVASYAFDSNSNRLSRTTPSGTDTATYDNQDRLLTYGGETFTYTANGEIATRTSPAGTTSYHYDALGNLVSVSLPDGRLIDYVVDARGRRVVKKIDGTVVAKFVYLDGLRPIAQLAADDSVVAQFVYAEQRGRLSLMIRGGVTYRIIADHVGSPRFIVDTATGTIADTVGYDEFGVEFETTPGFQPFGFAGGIYDADTKLVHFGARDYDPRTGRFLTKDPLNFAGGQLNVYDYAANDPVNFTDPSGLLFHGSVNAGEAYGQQATDWYADVLTDPHASTAAKFGAALGGFFAALWTPCTSDDTFQVLAGAAGGAAAARLSSVATLASEEELAEIAGHLGRLDPALENDLMMQRIQSAIENGERLTGADRNFYLHELAEKSLMDAGAEYGAAHEATLESQNMSRFGLYHPDVIQAADEAAGMRTFSEGYYNYWGLP